MQQNNPMQLMMQIRNSSNPMQMMNQIAQSDPRFAPAMQIINGKQPNQLRSIAENMMRERGLDPVAFAQQFGLTLPK